MMGLTRAETECLAFIEAYYAREGIMPSRREIMAGLNHKSTSNAERLVKGLVDRGRLRRLSRKARALALVTTVHCPNCNHGFDPTLGSSQ